MAKHLTYKGDVKRLLDLSEDTYNMNILEFSYSFLEYKGYSVPVIEILHSTPSYWIWWRNQFAIADMMFLNVHAVFDFHRYPLAMQIDQYKSCHIGINAFPSRIIEKINKVQVVKTRQCLVSTVTK
jgi:hypothetical protein